jgi:hypothetical protein
MILLFFAIFPRQVSKPRPLGFELSLLPLCYSGTTTRPMNVMAWLDHNHHFSFKLALKKMKLVEDPGPLS